MMDIFKKDQKVYLALSLSVAVFLLFFLEVSAAAASPSIRVLTKRMQESYEKTIDFTANFSQAATVQSAAKTIIEEGTVFIKKPKRMLWDYRKPSKKKLVINPEKAWMYIPEDNMVYVYDADKVLRSKMTVRFLTGIWKLEEDFIISYAEPKKTDSKGNYLLALKPLRYEAGIKEMFMTVDSKSFHIRETTFVDMYDNVTVLTFTGIKVNNDLPDDMFSFVPPEGVEVYEDKSR